MAFTRKFQKLLEIEMKDIEKPDGVWLTYAVCATEEDSCGWAGWMIEHIYKKDSKMSGDRLQGKHLSALDEQICPNCGKELKSKSKFCTECGEFINKCPGCGNEINKDSKFCNECGYVLN